MKKTIVALYLLIQAQAASAQLIRKNYQEMTTTEKTDFNTALQTLWNSGGTAINDHSWLANMHNTHFASNIHSGGGLGYNFTSFHRFFLLHWELLLKNTNVNYEYLGLPYWDWTYDPWQGNPSIPTAITDPNFWEYNNFLPIANFTPWGVTRAITLPPSANLPSAATVNSLFSITPFQPVLGTNFSQSLESVHGGAHVWVGGTMAGGLSPLDPVFYLHHAMVDKIWRDWEDQPTPSTTSSYPFSPMSIPGYNIGDGWIDDLDANDCIGGRNIPFRFTTLNSAVTYDVWYARSGRVILDGENGSDFLVNGSGKIYRYTTNGSPVLGGSINIGDLYWSGNTILSDTQGGFSVPAGVTAHFRAGGDITMLPGASFYANSTSEVTFKIITTPNGF